MDVYVDDADMDNFEMKSFDISYNKGIALNCQITFFIYFYGSCRTLFLRNTCAHKRF